MLYDTVKVVLASGETREMVCPDQRVEIVPPGSYVAPTCGYPQTHTVIAPDGGCLGWVGAADYQVGPHRPTA
jgi:hypothetical protein